MITASELLKPRYKVVGDYPGSHLKINQIIPFNYGQTDYDKPVDFNKYPAIFRRLEWWEERKPEEMPEYVKTKRGKVLFVAGFGNTASGSFHIGWNDQNNGLKTRPASEFLPATREEYEAQQDMIKGGY